MALIVITIQDTENGEVSVSAVVEPVLGGDEATPAQRAAARMITSIGEDKPKEENLIELIY